MYYASVVLKHPELVPDGREDVKWKEGGGRGEEKYTLRAGMINGEMATRLHRAERDAQGLFCSATHCLCFSTALMHTDR